jgi:hypothetical protein
MAKRYRHMGDVFAAIRNRERRERVDVRGILSAPRIVTRFARSFGGRKPFEVDDESIAAWIQGLFDGARGGLRPEAPGARAGVRGWRR